MTRDTVLRHALPAFVVWACLALPAQAAGTLRTRIDAAGTGTVQFQYAARPGVYGDGNNMMISRDRNGRRSDGDWCLRCMNGPVRVEMTLRNREVRRLELSVGGPVPRGGASVTDLGRVSPVAAAEYFVELAARAPESVGEEAVSAAALADSVVLWPHLIVLSRNRKLPTDVRKKALFWLGQAAGDAIGPTLDGMSRDDSEDLEVRKAAVFALSQRPHDESVRILMRIARSKIHPEVRRQAFFWLAQYDDAEVVDFFEEMLVGKK